MELSSASCSLIPTNPKFSILGISVRRLSLTHFIVSSHDSTEIVPGRRWAVEIKINDEFEDGCRPSDDAGIWEVGSGKRAIGTPLYASWPAFVWVNQVVRAAGIVLGCCHYNNITTVQDVVRKPSWKQGCVSPQTHVSATDPHVCPWRRPVWQKLPNK